MEYIEYEDKIKKIANRLFIKKSKVKSFFNQAYSKFNISDRRKILELFEKTKNSKSIAHWYNFINKNEEIKQIILSDAEKNMNTLLSEETPQFTGDLLKFTEIYLNLSEISIDDSKTEQILSRVSSLANKNFEILHSDEVRQILSYYLKDLAWKSSDLEYMQNIKTSSGFNIFEELICKYIDTLDLKQNLYDDDLILLVSELQNVVKSNQLHEAIQKKFKVEISLEESDLDNKTNEETLNAIISYRLKNGIIPKNLCSYLIRNNILPRVANIDYIKHYTTENGIEDAAIFYDNHLITPGIANFMRMALNNKSLDESSFHEATHVIQQADILKRKSFLGNRYAMLKDFILQKKVGWDVYNANHNNWIFEIDADTQGGLQYFEFLKSINSSEMTLEEFEAGINHLLTSEKQRLKSSKSIIINDKKVSKKDLFEKFLIEDPELIKRHPILSVEYNSDGTRKEIVSILESLATKYEEDENAIELQDVANCIIDDLTEFDEHELKNLEDFVSDSALIMNLKEKFIQKLISNKKSKSTLALAIESADCGNIDYIQETFDNMEHQEEQLSQTAILSNE